MTAPQTPESIPDHGMGQPEHQAGLLLRVTLALIGAAAGYFFWLLFQYLPEVIPDERLLILLASFAGTVFGGLLLTVGGIGLVAALRYALGLGIVASGLLFWASFRFDTLDGFLGSLHPLAAVFMLTMLPLPFFMARETAKAGWRDYGALFDHAWSIFVRGFTASLFTMLFWAVLLLSDALLGLVGFEYIGALIDHMWISLPLTGLVFGLALAVLNEMRAIVSTLRRLALQLLRLLLPLVSVVIALFIALVPFAGLDRVFGSFSAAATMLAMAAGAVTLITAAIDARDAGAARSRLMTLSARGLALLLPVIAAIAVYAVWLRVGQYGWTPRRLWGAIIAMMVLGYALSYALSVLRGARWRDHIRRANMWVALAMIGLSALWLTPLLNLERLAANNQSARFMAGQTSVADLDVWSMGDDWGKAGKAALARLRGVRHHPDQAALDAKLASYDAGESRWSYAHDQKNRKKKADEIKTLVSILPVMPAGATIPGAVFLSLPKGTVRDLIDSCRKALADGRPGCAAVLSTIASDGTGTVVYFIKRTRFGGSTDIVTVARRTASDAFFPNFSPRALGPDGGLDPDAMIGKILDGDFRIAPARLNTLQIGKTRYLPSR